MSGVLVDSNVLLDIFTDDPVWSPWSQQALIGAAETSRLVINAVIYAEVSIRFSRIEDLDDALSPSDIEREAVPFPAAFLAAKAYLAYRRRGGGRSAPLPDFFIGANAAIANYRLLTRDPARYCSYFPSVVLIAPEGAG